MTPQEFSKSPEPQVVTLAGRNFQPGLKLSVTDPTGTVTVADRIDKSDAQTVVVRLVFEQSGSYARDDHEPVGRVLEHRVAECAIGRFDLDLAGEKRKRLVLRDTDAHDEDPVRVSTPLSLGRL